MPYKYTDLPCVYIYMYQKIQKFGIAISFRGWTCQVVPWRKWSRSMCTRQILRVLQFWEHGQNAAGSAAGNLDQIIIRWVFFWRFPTWKNIPIGSMYGVFRYIYHQNQPNVGMYTIHGSYGIANHHCFDSQHFWETQKTTTKRRNRKKLGKKRYLTNNHGRRVCFGAKNVYVG